MMSACELLSCPIYKSKLFLNSWCFCFLWLILALSISSSWWSLCTAILWYSSSYAFSRISFCFFSKTCTSNFYLSSSCCLCLSSRFFCSSIFSKFSLFSCCSLTFLSISSSYWMAWFSTVTLVVRLISILILCSLSYFSACLLYSSVSNCYL